MMLWMITDVSEWTSIRKTTESWRLDIVRNIQKKCALLVVRNALMCSAVDVCVNLACAQMVRQL